MRRKVGMRKDVQLGIIFSMVVVLIVGGYYTFRDSGEPSIPVVGASTPAVGKPESSSKTPPTTSPATRNANSRTNANASRRTESQPTTREPLRPAAQPTPAPASLAGRTLPAPGASTTPPANSDKAEPSSPSPNTASAEQLAASPSIPNSALNPSPPSPASASVPSPSTAGSKPAESSGPLATNAAAQPAAPSAEGKPSPLASAPALTATSPLSTTAPPSAPAKDASKNQPQPSPAVDTHRVQPGDSFVSLAQNYYGSAKYVRFLQESNPAIADPTRLTPGAVVKIPPLPSDVDARLKESVGKELTASKTETSATRLTSPSSPAGKRSYKVKPGDSLYKIAKDQLGNPNRWKEILALNKAALKDDPSTIQVGQTLTLPE